MDGIPMYTVAKSYYCRQSDLIARCITKPDMEGIALEVLTSNPLRRVFSHHVLNWDENVLLHASPNLVVFAQGCSMLIVQPGNQEWTISPLESYDPIRSVIGCDRGRRLCVVTDLGVIIVRCRDLSVVKSFQIPGIQQLFCRSIDSGKHERQLLLTYLTNDGVVYTFNIDGDISSNRISPSHGCLECSAEQFQRLVQDPKNSAAFIALQDVHFIFFSHTPDMVWISKPQPVPENTSDLSLSNLFDKWHGVMRKRSNSV